MLGQHTAEFGQEFEPAAIERLFTQTAGQPWLVNALCEEACFKDPQGRDRSHAITENDILAAQEVLLQRQVVHLNQLADRLQEESVQRVIEPMLSGAAHRSYATRDLEFVRNLGLVALAAPPRELTYATPEDLVLEPTCYIDDDGGLNLGKPLEAFQKFCREKSEHWLKLFQY